MTVLATDWKVGFNSGGRLLPKGHVVSIDGNFAITIFQSHLRVYSLETRQSIKSIDIHRNLLDVVDVHISRINPHVIFLFTSSKEIFAVNWKAKAGLNPLLKHYTIKIDGNYDQLLNFVCFSNDGEVKGEFETGFVLLFGKPSVKSGNHQHSIHTRHMIRYSAKNEQVDEMLTIKDITLFAKSTDGKNQAFATNGNEMVYTSISDDDEVSSKVYKFPYKASVTSIAISNGIDPSVALGTSTGVIQVLYLGQEPRQVFMNQRLLKWHIDPVTAMEFSPDGTYLITGGSEKVLVFWQLETEKQQFLPRLAGRITNISIDNRNERLYGVVMEFPKTTNNEEAYYQYLVLNSVDLSSKLDVNGLRPNFVTDLHKALGKDSKRMVRKDFKLSEETLTRLKHDVTSKFAIEPSSGLMYLPHGSYMQVYDVVKNDQLFVATLAQTVQQGKVKGEASIKDPVIEHFSFSKDGRWMCTFDTLKAPDIDHLISSDDVKYCLKFWKLVEAGKGETNGHWELCSKIMDPHGSQVPICSMIAAPESYRDGLGFLTADVKGGVRLWRPRSVQPKEGSNKKTKQVEWTLRHVRYGAGQMHTSSVALAWSSDASLIAVGMETSVMLLDVSTFEPIGDQPLLTLVQSRIRAVEIVGDHLIVLAKREMISFDLLTYQMTPLALRTRAPIGGKALLAVDDDRKLVCLCQNYYYANGPKSEDAYSVRSRIFVFTPSSIKPVYIVDHRCAISGVSYSKKFSGFVLLDIDANVGILNTVTSKFLLEEEERKERQKAYEMSTLLGNAQRVARASAVKRNIKNTDDDHVYDGKVLNPETFEPILDNMEGLPVETLFDRVMSVL